MYVVYYECGTGFVGRGKMSRPIMLVFLLVILIVTSQFEWRQPLLELDAAPSLSHKHQQIAKREDAVKEKVHSLILTLLMETHCLFLWFGFVIVVTYGLG